MHQQVTQFQYTPTIYTFRSENERSIDLNIYTKILEVNLFAFANRLFCRDFSPLDGTYIVFINF